MWPVWQSLKSDIKQVAGVVPTAGWPVPGGLSLVMVAIRKATGAIPYLNRDEKLDCEAHHWDYLCRYRPQQAMMAHTMAGGGKMINFSDTKFV
jgi:hypothetical protein